MARRKTHAPLAVYLNSRLMGRLVRETSGAIAFTYDASWLDWESAIPVSHSMPLREDRYIGSPVFAVFDNLLPDSADIRRHLAERAGADGDDAFSLLSAVGRDCVGAMQFMPEGEQPDAAGTINSRPATDKEISHVLSELRSFPLGVGEVEDFRISLAGAQEKTALLRLKGKWHFPLGTTPTTHIIKPQIGPLPSGLDMSQSVENEHLCMRLVEALGLPVAQTEIGSFAGKRALIVERFDCRWTRDNRLLRLPQEDCCQALSVPPTKKYQAEGGPGVADLAGLLKASDTPAEDTRILLKAQLVFWLLAATDGHAKNFSIHLLPSGRFKLAPLYDILSVQPAIDAGQLKHRQIKLAMSVGKSPHYAVNTILPRHFIETAKLAGVSEAGMRDLFAELAADADAAIEKVRSRLPEKFPAAMTKSIVNGFTNRLKILPAA